jgi:hypothetical protein
MVSEGRVVAVGYDVLGDGNLGRKERRLDRFTCGVY